MPVDKINPTAYEEMEFHIKQWDMETYNNQNTYTCLNTSFSIYIGIVPVFKFRFDCGVLFFMSTTYDQKHWILRIHNCLKKPIHFNKIWFAQWNDCRW